MEFTDKLKESLILELKEAVKNKAVKPIRDLEEEYTPADFAEAIEQLETFEQVYVLRVLRTSDAAEIFAYLEDELKASLATSFTEEWGLKILNELQTDELADVLEDLPVNLMRKILLSTDEETRKKLNSIFNYNEDQIGSIMAVDITFLKDEWTVKKAIKKIKSDYKNTKSEFSHNFYVVDNSGRLLGDITLEELVFSNDEALLSELYSVVASVHPEDDKEDAAIVFSEQDRSTLPVVSKDNFLIGMITSDDVIDVIQEQATEDMYKLAGINPEAAEESYLKTSVMQIVKSRVFWLLILMVSSTMSQFIIQQFTDLSETFINGLSISISSALIVGLIPIISGSAGNAGSQSSTTITRASALGDIEDQDLWKVVNKELRVGTVIGLIMFVANVVRLYIYFAVPAFRGNSGWSELSFIIIASSLSLFLVIIFAKFLGTIIPLVAIKFNKDPAVMSAPILATLSDALSTLIFFCLNMFVLWMAAKAGWIGSFEKAKVAKEGIEAATNTLLALDFQNLPSLTQFNFWV
ncbi:magnesium transporter [Mycoplasmopsis gallopavonis]|uniref:Magnesium transporter MgtE n=1 Tax=Mycoplasmopsis gallopavonis TaxID=76629 RepID=A0A449B055_9BACT|nr:magnesium transporter [Mycoplasmopsis gallopavonis]RIV16848.1 magnesium transporter [Mycoplasmopsis gallopavonis]VEU73152.1 Magnesium transporter mgtE [Mycoplasmopsis gallopavonis]